MTGRPTGCTSGLVHNPRAMAAPPIKGKYFMELKLGLFPGSIPDRLSTLQHALDAFKGFLFAAEAQERFSLQIKQILLADERRLAQIAATHDIGQFLCD